MRDKLQVNSDYFPTEEARMAYVFNRTGGDAQAHLHPRYIETSEDPFLTDQDMINYLSSIYEDPHRVQNARLKYKGLMMKPTETFADFHTRFLHLAGQAKIPKEDLRLDLFDKLTLELQRIVLLVYSLLTTVKALADKCLSLDQGLRRIKAHLDRDKSYINTSQPATSLETVTGSHPIYSNPLKQTLSNQGACFLCGQKGHFAKDCPVKEEEDEDPRAQDNVKSEEL